MILTCPECAARYQVEDGRVGPEGRTVRCANCGASWRAVPDLTLATPAAAEAPAANKATGGPASAARAWRDRKQARKETVRAAGSGVAFAAVGVLVVALLLAALVFRGGVVAAVPQTASLFAAIGLPVNPTGVEFENLAAQPVLRDNQALVVVTGVMRNVTDRPVTPHGVRVALTDRTNRELAVTVARSSGDAIPAGQTRAFTLTFDNPPVGAAGVEARLADETPPAAAPAPGRIRATSH